MIKKNQIHLINLMCLKAPLIILVKDMEGRMSHLNHQQDL